MALWRDPLDELIESLETTLPADNSNGPYELLPRIEELQKVLPPLLYGSAEAREQIERDPMYHRVMRQLQERAKRWTEK
jgi:hypothetical protein